MASKTKTVPLTAPISADEMVTVPRAALQALAEWAYPVFAWDRIWSKIPAKNPRASIHDELHNELERERQAFLKGMFWKAEQEASRRERALDPARGYGGAPSLELFMECVAEMDDHHFDEPLTRKEMTDRKRAIKAKKNQMEEVKASLSHRSVESTCDYITIVTDVSVAAIKENLAHESAEVRAKAKAEFPRILEELAKLDPAS